MAVDTPENSNGSNQLRTDDESKEIGSYTPIKSLNTFLFDWTIKARVTKKHAKKAW
jgi:hypothetical protein